MYLKIMVFIYCEYQIIMILLPLSHCYVLEKFALEFFTLMEFVGSTKCSF